MSQLENMHPSTAPPMELEHTICYTGRIPHNMKAFNDRKKGPSVVFGVGTAVAVSTLGDTHDQRFLRSHTRTVSAVAVSNNGKLFASGEAKSEAHKASTVIVWHAEACKKLLELKGATEGVLRLEFSPDNRLLAALTHSCCLLVWDLEHGEIVLSEKCASPLTTLCWGGVRPGRNDRPEYTLASGMGTRMRTHVIAFDPRMMEYRTNTRVCSVPSRGLVRRYVSSTFDPSGKYIAAGTDSGDAVVFNFEHASYSTSLEVPGVVNGVCWVEDKLYVGGNGVIKAFVSKRGQWAVSGESTVEGRISSLCVNKHTNELVAGTMNGMLYRISMNNLSARQLVAASNVAPVAAVSFSANSEMFGTVAQDGQVVVWDIADYTVRVRARVNARGAHCVFGEAQRPAKHQPHHVRHQQYHKPQPVVTAPECALFTAWDDGSIRAFSAEDGAELWHTRNAHAGGATCLAWTSQFIVSGGKDGRVRLWSPSNGQFMLEASVHKGPVRAVLVDVNDPAKIHSCGDDRVHQIFDLRRETRVGCPHQIQNGVFTCMTQRKDSEQEIVTAQSHGKIQFWDCDLQPPVEELEDCEGKVCVHALSVSPDGRFLAAGNAHGRVKVYETKSQRLLADILGHSGPVSSLDWSPDQRQLVSTGTDCSISIWNIYV